VSDLKDRVDKVIESLRENPEVFQGVAEAIMTEEPMSDLIGPWKPNYGHPPALVRCLWSEKVPNATVTLRSNPMPGYEGQYVGSVRIGGETDKDNDAHVVRFSHFDVSQVIAFIETTLNKMQMLVVPDDIGDKLDRINPGHPYCPHCTEQHDPNGECV